MYLIVWHVWTDAASPVAERFAQVFDERGAADDHFSYIMQALGDDLADAVMYKVGEIVTSLAEFAN